MLKVTPVKAFEDNYIWMIELPDQPRAIAVDPGDAAAVEAYLTAKKMELAAILVTHHHDDHIGGIEALKQGSAIPVYGAEHSAVTAITHPLRHNQHFSIDGLGFRMLVTPGHTLDHVVYILEDQPLHLFSGDLLFSGSCGRIFEGSAEQMFTALQSIKQLPASTLVYPAHEYTLANLTFAKAAEGDNRALRVYEEVCQNKRAEGQPTLPTSIDTERRINPFLRTHSASVRTAAEQQSAQPLNTELEVFSALRQWKDRF